MITGLLASRVPRPSEARTTSRPSRARAGIAESLRAPGGPLPFQRGGMGDHTVAMTGAAMVERGSGRAGVDRTGPARLDFTVAPGRVHHRLRRQRRARCGVEHSGIGTRERPHSPVLNDYTGGMAASFWIVPRRRSSLAGLSPGGGTPGVDHDSRFDSARNRAVNARELIGLLDEIFATRTLDEWAATFAAEPELFGVR